MIIKILLEQAIPINKQINMLEKIAYSTKMSETDFMNKLNVCLKIQILVWILLIFNIINFIFNF